MTIVGLPPDTIFDVFPLIRGYFESFAKRTRGEVTAVGLARDVASGSKQCWIARDDDVKACALTRIWDGDVRVVEIVYCAGADREGWQSEMVDKIAEWAEEIGAQRLRTINRPGWAAFLRSKGLRETHRVMERDIGS